MLKYIIILYDVSTRVQRARVTCTDRRLLLKYCGCGCGGGSNSGSSNSDDGGGGGEQQVVVTHTHAPCSYTKHTHVNTHTRTRTHKRTHTLPESDMITINRTVASIVAAAAAAKCIQFLITGWRNCGKQDETPSAGRSVQWRDKR